MNLACPECSTVYRVDPARVPRGGIAARCRECATVLRVEPGAAQRPGDFETASAVDSAGPGASPPAATTVAEPTVAEPREPEVREPAPREPGAGEPEAPTPPPTEPVEKQAAAAPASPAFGPQDPQTRARRLARALVSDIKVYNPDKWEESRRQGRLRKDFRDEILKSWEEYVEQVGEEMAKKTPYFREALNEILAGGERVF